MRNALMKEPASDVTHQLAWCPADMCGGPGWSLFTITTGRVEYVDFTGEDLPGDTAPEVLANLVATALGQRVTLTPGEYQFKSRRFGRPRSERLYWVTPAQEGN